MAGNEDGPNDLRTPFVFQPYGTPDPVAFMSTLGEVLRIPATVRADLPERFIHPDAALPTGTRTPSFPQGVPASLGAVNPQSRDDSRFALCKYPPRRHETTPRMDPAGDYLSHDRIWRDAMRLAVSPGFADGTGMPPCQSTAQIIQAADAVRAQAQAAIRRLQDASTKPVRLALQAPPEEDGEVGPEGRLLSPQDEVNRDAYNAAVGALSQLDPNNPALTTVTSPDYVPSDADVARVREALARVQQHGSSTPPDEKADERAPTQFLLPGEPLLDRLTHPPKLELEPMPQDAEKPVAPSVPPSAAQQAEPKSSAP